MKTLKTLLLSLFIAAFALTANAQLSDSDLMITEMFNAEFPTDEGTITLENGVSGDYELLSYNVLGDLDEVEGRDAAVGPCRPSFFQAVMEHRVARPSCGR